jgi:GT2 family glycosyltransferase
LNRPPYILAHPGDNQGCGYHRILRPLEIMMRAGVATGRAEFNFMPEQYLKVLAPDVVVWQRQGDGQLEMMQRYRTALPDAFFVYEIDDAIADVPDTSWHKPFLPPNINRGIKNSVALCDAVSVTTRNLATHMRDICGDIDVRVIPNMLGIDDFENAHQARFAARNPRQRPPKKHNKFRIGWGGGIGHTADFGMMKPVFEHFGDTVDWCFLGMDPDTPLGVSKFFAGAVPPNQYLVALANLDVDLMIAPLDDNHFNRCKSNLRLIEAGACVYPVIASRVAPYVENAPPVYAHCATADEWIAAIAMFMTLSDSQRGDHAQRLHTWAKRHYCLDTKAAERMEGWLPKGIRAFEPALDSAAARAGGKNGVIVVVGKQATVNGITTTVSDLQSICEDTTADILYVRDSIVLPPDMIERLRRTGNPKLATISFFSNDGAYTGFPKMNSFTAIDAATADGIHETAKDIFEDQVASTGIATGPCMLIRRAALETIGFPDFRIGNTEMAIIEWSGMAAARGFENVIRFDFYLYSKEPRGTPATLANEIALRMGLRWPPGKADQPAITQARQELELAFHRLRYRGLPEQRHRTEYPLWAAIFDTPGPRDLAAIEKWKALAGMPTMTIAHDRAELQAAIDANIDWIVCAAATTEIDDFFSIYVTELEKNLAVKLIYSDHDILNEKGLRGDHHFKPDFDHHYFLGLDYVTPLMAIEGLLASRLLPACAADTDSDVLFYELALRTIETCGRDSIGHVQRICAHLAPVDPAVLRANAPKKAALADAHAKRYGMPVNVCQHPVIHDCHEVQYVGGYREEPKVTIIIPTKNRVEMLMPCLNTLLSMTTYKNFDVLIVDNGSDNPEMLSYLDSLTDKRIEILVWAEPYNWSKLNNFAVSQTDSEILCFLNDDTRILAPIWLSEMVAATYAPGAGAIGAKLLYPHGAIQHIGVISHRGNNGHLHKGLPAHLPGYHGLAMLSHENSCVTGACMVVRRQLFDEVGGFPEYLSHNYNDVAFCLELRRRNYFNIVACRAQLQHFEGVTRTKSNSEEGMRLLRDEGTIIGERYPDIDRYWNSNLVIYLLQGGMVVAGLNMDHFVWPPLPWPWRDQDWPFQRILMLGPDRSMFDEWRDGDAIYELEVTGFKARFAKPPLENTLPFDIRNPKAAVPSIALMGIDKIVVTELGEAPPAMLGFLVRLGVPVEYRPINAESVCARRDLMQNGRSCDQGYRKGACQMCLDTFGSSHGHIAVMSWLAEWMRFFNEDIVSVDLNGIESSDYIDAIDAVYRGNGIALPVGRSEPSGTA